MSRIYSEEAELYDIAFDWDLSEEAAWLAKGFGPVALSIFPDPVTGNYKDACWQALGEELMTLLTPEEYASAKRTTFNAFYTSPTVIAAMHDALARLGVPANATVLEPGCGSGRMLVALAAHGVEAVGIDTSEEMLALARARGCEVVRADMTDFEADLERGGSLIWHELVAQ